MLEIVLTIAYIIVFIYLVLVHMGELLVGFYFKCSICGYPYAEIVQLKKKALSFKEHLQNSWLNW